MSVGSFSSPRKASSGAYSYDVCLFIFPIPSPIDSSPPSTIKLLAAFRPVGCVGIFRTARLRPGLPSDALDEMPVQSPAMSIGYAGCCRRGRPPASLPSREIYPKTFRIPEWRVFAAAGFAESFCSRQVGMDGATILSRALAYLSGPGRTSRWCRLQCRRTK